MRAIIGIFIMILGVFLGFYVGLYLCLYGGVVQVIEGIKAGWEAGSIALGVVRVLCASFLGGISFYITFIVGWLMVVND